MDLLITNLRIAVRNLLSNRVRSLLTLLGLFIGIAAVIAIVSMGEGLKRFIQQETEDVGQNVLYVIPDRVTLSGRINRRAEPFTNEDVEFVRSNSETIADSEALSYGAGVVKYGNNVRRLSVAGIEPGFWDFEEMELEQGRTFNRAEMKGNARVAIVGHGLSGDIIPEQIDPIGQTLKINGSDYRIIGTVAEVGASGGFNPDESVFVPLTTFQRRIGGGDEVMIMYIRAKSAGALGVSDTRAAVKKTKRELTRLLRIQRKVPDPTKDDFKVLSIESVMELASGFLDAVIAVFGAIAVIALLVGGVGVMNIMLVSVAERTHEIGLRKAVGAHPATIANQFLLESGLLTLIGGIGGLILGYGLAWYLNWLLRDQLFAGRLIAPTIPLHYLLMAVGGSILIGLLFGTLPAVRAARMDPVDALRS